jgi:hypothetical protein
MGHESMTLAQLMPEVPQRRRRWIWVVAAATALVLAGGGIGLYFALRTPSVPGLSQLVSRDKSGAAACELMARWLRGDERDPATGKRYDSITMSAAAGPLAAKSSTAEIRGSASAPVDLSILRVAGGYQGDDMTFANLAQLDTACRGAGVELPPYVN